jgi:hypothetical protein
MCFPYSSSTCNTSQPLYCVSFSSYPKSIFFFLMLPSTQNVTLERALILHMLFQKWGSNVSAKCMIERPNLKLSPFWMDLTDFIFATLSQPERVQKIKDQRTKWPSPPPNHALVWYKNYSTEDCFKELYMICHQSLVIVGNAKQFWKRCF